MAKLLGTTQDRMLAGHDFANVLGRWPGRGIGGDKFPMLEATVRAKAMWPLLEGRVVVLLGHNVARAFGQRKFAYFENYVVMRPENPSSVLVPLMAVVPHPSGINRYWNTQENRDLAQKFLQYFVGEADKLDGSEPKSGIGQDFPFAGLG